MQGVRLDKKDLIQKFKLSNRLAIRVGALLAKKVDITATVLELAAPGSDMERLLCLPALLKQASNLTTESLGEVIESGGIEPDAPLAVVEEEGWRTIALEEELLAEEGWKAAEAEEAKQISLPVLQSTSISRREPAGEELSPEEVRELKLKALTSSDEGERAASVRRLLYASIPDQEKAAAFFEILVDPMSRGRTEALTGFEGMGFNADASAALRDILRESTSGFRFAIDRLRALLDTLDEAHSVIVTGVLLEALRTAEAEQVKENVLYALSRTARVIALNDNYLKIFLRESLKAIQAFGNTMSAPARLVLHGVAEAEPAAILPLLTVLAHLETDEERRVAVAQTMAKQVVARGETESARLLLGHNLTSLGEAAVKPLLDLLMQGPAEHRAFAVPFLDTLGVEKNIPKPLKNEIAKRFLEALKVQERRVRLAILETRVCADEDVSRKLRGELAAEFVNNLRQFPFPDINEQIQSAIEAAGAAAVDPLFAYAKKHKYDELTDVVVRILGRVVATLADQGEIESKRAKPIIDFCMDRVHDDRVPFGGYVSAIGRICASPLGGPAVCEELVTDLLTRAWGLPYTEDALEALGYLAASNHVPLERKIIVSHIFLKVIKAKKPDLAPKETETEDGIIYEFGEESNIDTVVVPAAVEGITRICLCEEASDVLRRQITIQLMRVWREASGWVVIWSPLAVERIARSLGTIASSDKTPMETKLDIGKIVRDQIPERLSVVRALGEICSQEVTSAELDELSLQAMEGILEHWIGPESEADEWAIAIACAARIAARNALNPRMKRARAMREKIIEILFDALRDHRRGARESLQMLAECTGLSKKRRKEIEDRLKATVGLVKL